MPGMFRFRLPWTAAPEAQPASARRPRQRPRFVLSRYRRSGSPPAPLAHPAPPPAAGGEDRAAGGLPDAWIEAADGALSANTRRALKADLRIYRAWCAEQGREAVPAAPDTVAAFVDAMAATRAPATVRRYVASIAAAHRAHGCPDATKSPAAKLALQRMHRRKGRRQEQATGLTGALRERLLAVPGDRPIDIRNRALLAVSYDTLLRRSELAALRVCDLTGDRTTGAGTVLVRNSKTDAEGEGAVLYIAPDTMALVAEWLELAGIADGRLFRSLSRGQLGEALDPSQIPRIYKAMARKAGLDPEVAGRLSGHSPRVGAAQDMVACDIQLPAIQQAGRWKSPDMVQRYGERLLAGRSAAAQLARMQGRDGPAARRSPPAPASAAGPACGCAPDPAAQPQPGPGKPLPETPGDGRRDEPAADPVLRRLPGSDGAARRTPNAAWQEFERRCADARLRCGDPADRSRLADPGPAGPGHDLFRLRPELPDPVPLLRHADAVAWPGRRFERESSVRRRPP